MSALQTCFHQHLFKKDAAYFLCKIMDMSEHPLHKTALQPKSLQSEASSDLLQYRLLHENLGYCVSKQHLISLLDS